MAGCGVRVVSVEAQAAKSLLDVFVPMEPMTGGGQKSGERQERLVAELRKRVRPEVFEELGQGRGDRLVTVTVLFHLWKGSGQTGITRPVKEIDNLLKALFDVLKMGPRGLGVVEEDSFVCELYACKQLVEDKEEEGYRIIVEEYEDPDMLGILKEYYSSKNTGP